VLKVTPAHDKADFEIGQRHNLPIVDIMNPNGTMNELAGDSMAGLDRFEARTVAVDRLRELGALVDEKPYENNVGFSQRADVPIEPRLSEQWFLKYPAVEQSKACVEQPGSADVSSASDTNPNAGGTPALPGKMRFHPDRWAKVYDHWLANIQDWCISRQLWWGHRIPVWTKRLVLSEEESWPVEIQAAMFTLWEEAERVETKQGIVYDFAKETNGSTGLLFAATFSEADAKRLEELGFTQDPDVLDTWFSSWLWPFATMGWTGDKTQDSNTPTLQKFYPTTDLVTGPDIIFFWVARMIMAGYEFMEDLPFRNVYFTGIIRDKQGRKMSKSLGNSPDPLELIAKYGADALRFGTMRSAPLGQDVLFDEKDVELGRNFCNKLWNACRFRQMQGGEVQGEINPKLLATDDKWILLKLDLAIREITGALNNYNFSLAVQTLYRFFWNEYCDWYVEASKAILSGSHRGNEAEPAGSAQENPPPHVGGYDEGRRANKLAVIDFILSNTLSLFHPFLPFISEELWHGMGYAEDMPEYQGGRTIMYAPWPKALDEDFKGHYGLDDCYLEMVDAKYELVTQGRNLRRTANIPSGKKVKYVFKPVNYTPPYEIEVIKLLLNAEALEVDQNYESPKGTPTVRTELGELCLPLEGHVDVAAEKMRLTKEKEKIEGEIAKAEQKLANPNFVQKVPPQVLLEHQQRLADWHAKLEHVKNALQALEG
jgi:valyl-tRNA synthetase